MKPVKLWIKKQIETRPGWWHYVPQFWLLLDDYCGINNETDLCKYIYQKCGQGRYLVLAWQKGYEGFWCFWLGNLYDNGYFRDINKNTYIERMNKQFQKDLKEAQNYEEKREIEENYEEEKEFEKELNDAIKSNKRRGPIGIKVFRPNILHGYNEYE